MLMTYGEWFFIFIFGLVWIEQYMGWKYEIEEMRTKLLLCAEEEKQ